MSFNWRMEGEEQLNAVKMVLEAIGEPVTELPTVEARHSHGTQTLRSIEVRGKVFEEFIEVDDEDCDGISQIGLRGTKNA